MGTVLLMRRRRIKGASGAGHRTGWPSERAGTLAGAMVSSEQTLIRLPLSGRSR
jgi:hypothetical protein